VLHQNSELPHQVIDHFNEKHTLEDSLQMFLSAQRDEIETLAKETFVLRAHTLKGAAQRSRQDSSTKEQDEEQGALQRAKDELDETHGHLLDEIKALGAAIEGVASAAECKLNVALRTNGCSPANIYEYLSCVHNQLDDFERDGRVPASIAIAMTPSGSTLSLVRDWVEVAHQVANQLPSTHEKDEVDWALEAAGDDDEEEHVHKTPAFIKWQSKRDQRDRHLILWGEQSKAAARVNTEQRDPLSVSGRPVDVKPHSFWATEATEGASLESSSVSVNALSLGSKRASLVPYMDEPYSATERR